MSTLIRQYLGVTRTTVKKLRRPEDVGQIWRRVVPMPYPPNTGDEIVLWPDADDPGSGITMPVRARWWAYDGQPCVGLGGIWVCPDAEAQARLPGSMRTWDATLEATWPIDACLSGGGWELLRDGPPDKRGPDLPPDPLALFVHSLR